jgi:microcystin-dependent protein
MAINFPDSPSVNDTHTVGDKTWVWDGTVWSVVVSFTNTPAGAVVMYGGGTAPSGWLVCDGSAVSRTTYADLFSAIGERYGAGDGSTTFNLPGTSTLVPVGIAASGNADGTTVSGSSTLNALALGDQSADHAHTITSNAGNQSADHSHTITVANANANHSHTITVANANANHSHTITVANANANHSHSWSKNFNTTNQNASHTHGYFKTNNSNVSANTNNQSASHSHNFNSGTVNTNAANAGHTHNASSGAVNATHAHNANSAAANAAHSHNASSGDNSADHNHTITSNAGNQSANHNHALTSSTVSTTINVEPFLFIIKT